MTEKKKKAANKRSCFCPYCEEELIVAESPFCKLCKVTFYRCTSCKAVLTDKNTAMCPECGTPLK